jgi:hypothetical protein
MLHPILTKRKKKGGKRRKQKDCEANCYSRWIALEATRKGKEGDGEEEEAHKVLYAVSTMRVPARAWVGRRRGIRSVRDDDRRGPSGDAAA